MCCGFATLHSQLSPVTVSCRRCQTRSPRPWSMLPQPRIQLSRMAQTDAWYELLRSSLMRFVEAICDSSEHTLGGQSMHCVDRIPVSRRWRSCCPACGIHPQAICLLKKVTNSASGRSPGNLWNRWQQSLAAKSKRWGPRCNSPACGGCL